jgi:nucleoid-associated protein YgaU
MFVMDPLERVNAFYTFDAGRNALTEAKGYFIYYDKNKSMHEYMLKNKAEEFTTQPPSFIELTKMEHASGIPSPSSLLGFGDAPGESPEDIIHRHQSERVRKRGAAEQRRTTNLLVSLSAVLLIVCFVMGAGLIQNQGRIANMEDQLVQINTAYRNLISQYGTAPVFAAQQEPTPTAPVPTAPAQPQSAESTYSFELQPEDFNLAAETGSLAVTDPIDAVQPATETLAAQPVTEPGVTVSENEQALPYYEAYTIQPGDSLIAISVRFYGDKSMVDEILALNGIEDADHIVAGKTIALPKK